MEFVVAIVAIVMGAGLIKHWINVRHNRPDMDSWLEQAGLEDMEPGALKKQTDRIEKLEQRVRVLERIVTDKKHKLADEIDGL